MEGLGLVHLYTGNGKGKTTAAVGLAVRAISQGFRVCYAIFNKNPEKYGINETHTLDKLGAKVMQFTQEHPSFNKETTIEEYSKKTLHAFEAVLSEMRITAYDLLVMDELLISVRDGFIDEQIVLDFIANKPKDLELVLTGRGATENLKLASNYVNEIIAVKHPMEKGVFGRKGIEF
ncbi:MAG: cob(I)yrinic acid a,c-diamide adenosyltransferase [Salinivirgaceae bacterium]|jgi:cob(I)alamin adenosyltransferase|nr:cob(I)yrinic acid a,c-diamide adenosyltransferase [Salinivirgaceae bacterium]